MALTSLTPLCLADDATFWPWRSWTDFAQLSHEERIATTVIVPIAGFSDWGLGHGFDAEEIILMTLLREALPRAAQSARYLMIPPLRFVLGPTSAGAFSVEPPAAHSFLREVSASIASTGFRRVLFVNASPWNEELCSAASRDLRIEFGLQIFRLNLSGIDLDFHPTRSKSRRHLQTLLTAITGVEPELQGSAIPARETRSAGDWGDETFSELAGPALQREEAEKAGAALLATATARIVALLSEISSRPPLPRDGALMMMSPP